MSNISNNMQTQTSNALHNAILEADSKDRNPTTTTERVFETYKNVTQDIRDQLNAEAEAVQIILTGINNDIYSTVDACPNAYMPDLEDITYFNDEDAVGAEADHNNLEFSIPISPIPTTRIHKDHPVSQIIGDLSAQTRAQVDKTEKENKGKSPVESFIGYRDFNAEFKDCSNNNSNKVNASSSTVPTVGQNFINSTNTFSAAGPFNPIVSPTYDKSSSIDASTLPHDPDMPDLEDITYFNDEDAVGAEAD
nr:ribonuclease H-like domain-containing protein [Tanacetum cinerariifolium]